MLKVVFIKQLEEHQMRGSKVYEVGDDDDDNDIVWEITTENKGCCWLSACWPPRVSFGFAPLDLSLSRSLARVRSFYKFSPPQPSRCCCCCSRVLSPPPAAAALLNLPASLPSARALCLRARLDSVHSSSSLAHSLCINECALPLVCALTRRTAPLPLALHCPKALLALLPLP